MRITSRTLPFAVMATGLLLSSGVLAQNAASPPAENMPAQPPAAGTETPGAMSGQGTMSTTHTTTHHKRHVRHHAPTSTGTASAPGGAMTSSPGTGGSKMEPSGPGGNQMAPSTGGGTNMAPAGPGTEKQ